MNVGDVRFAGICQRCAWKSRRVINPNNADTYVAQHYERDDCRHGFVAELTVTAVQPITFAVRDTRGYTERPISTWIV